MDLARRYMAGGVMHHLFPVLSDASAIIARGEGSHIWDADGKEYVDCYMGSTAATVGHGHPEVLEAVRNQQALGANFYALTPPALELAELIAQVVPSVERVKYANSGSEATMVALRLGRALSGKSKILKFEGGFHGTHDWTAWGSLHRRRFDYPFAEPDSLGVPRELRDLVLVAPFNDLETASHMIQDHRHELGAVIAEPVLGNVNIKPKPGFLQGIRQVTQDCSIPFILDEVVTGFRLALGGGQEYYGVRADIVTLGKALGGGYPIGAIAGKAQFMEFLSPEQVGRGKFVMYSGSFSGNPVSCAAAIAAIRIFQKPGTYERLHSVGQRLGDAFRAMSRELGIKTVVQNEGPTVNLWFTDGDVSSYRDTWTADSKKEKTFKLGLMKRGVWSPPGQKFFLSLAHSDDDLDRVIKAAEESMSELR